VREGIKRSRALKAVTLWPAEMLGLEDRLGSLEPGKDANILVLSGDPLDIETWVENVFVQGVEVYDRDDDIRLKRLLSSPEEELGPSSKPDEATTKEGEGDGAAAKAAKRDGDKKSKKKQGKKRGRRKKRSD